MEGSEEGSRGLTGGHVLRCDVTTPTSYRSIKYERMWTADLSARWTEIRRDMNIRRALRDRVPLRCGNLTSVYKVSEQRLKSYDVTDVGLLDYLFVLRSHKVIRYDTKEEFNVDSKVK